MIRNTLLQERKATAKLSKTNNGGGLQSSNAMNGAFTISNVGGSNAGGVGGSTIGSGKNQVVVSKTSIMYRPRGESHDGPLPSLSGACAVYLHCLALLKDCMQRTTATHHQVTHHQMTAESNHPASSMAEGGGSNVHVMTLRHVQQGLTALFDQIILRVEQCHKRLSTLPNPTYGSTMGGRSRSASIASGQGLGVSPGTTDGMISVASASPTTHSPPWLLTAPLHSIHSPSHYPHALPVPSSTTVSAGRITAEPLMYRAALQLARDASVDELLGNLQQACDSYTSARLLIEGVMMTATEPSDRATLQHFAHTFGEQYTQCRMLLESHSQILPGLPGGGVSSMGMSNAHTTVKQPSSMTIPLQNNNNNNNNNSNSSPVVATTIPLVGVGSIGVPPLPQQQQQQQQSQG